jgi:putative transposase
MRLNRNEILFPESGTAHVMWRCHNKEFYLADNKMKDLLLRSEMQTQKTHAKLGEVLIHGFCVMNNHFHKVVSYSQGSESLSRFMRKAHGIFGQRYNRMHRRSGKVAEARPLTPLIQNAEHQMRVHFYIEANPIKAGLITLEGLKKYRYSSYGFYAWGVKSEFTSLLTVPDWYMALGSTMKERQKIYRTLFKEYLDTILNNYIQPLQKYFIGSQKWVQKQAERIQLFRMNPKAEMNSC